MAGHSKWAQIKRQKAVTDAKQSKIFSKLARQISAQAKISKGIDTPELRAAVEKARAANAPKDIIERAIKKGASEKAMEAALYEAFGPGGAAILIEVLTDNKNRITQEIKHMLSKNGLALGGPGAATWAFEKKEGRWVPKSAVPLSENDLLILDRLVDELEENDDVQEVYTNAE